MEINNILGGLILKNIPNIKVDVHNPEYLLKIEIRKDYLYIYKRTVWNRRISCWCSRKRLSNVIS